MLYKAAIDTSAQVILRCFSFGLSKGPIHIIQNAFKEINIILSVSLGESKLQFDPVGIRRFGFLEFRSKFRKSFESLLTPQ